MTEDIQRKSDRGVADPTMAPRELTEPTMIMDRSGHVLAWYLPGAVSQPNQVCVTCLASREALMQLQSLMWENLALLEGALLGSIQAGSSQNWRTAPQYFRTEAALKGAINLSPGWFQQGRHVSAVHYR